MKKLLSLLLSIILLFGVVFSFTSCIFPEEAKRVFNEIDKIEKHSDYAIITRREYITATEKIVFEDIVRNKISKDGHKINQEKFGSFQRFGDFIVFSLNYKSGKRFWGINDSNNYWAIGIISLDDFLIEIHYLKNKYEQLTPSFTSNTHLSFDAFDEDKESTKNKNTYRNKDYEWVINTFDEDEESTKYEDYECIIINRSNEEITILNGMQLSPPEIIGNPIESYRNPNSFAWNGETYTISNGSSNSVIRNEKKELVAELDCSVEPLSASFGYSDILQISPELQEINDILGEGSEDEIEAHFFTNGEDLFVGFVTERSMFGAECYLIYPVIFKTDLNFDSFEYIGCVSDSYLYNFYSTVQIDKIN